MTPAFGRTWCVSKRLEIEQIFPHTLLITSCLWLQGFLELRKVGLRLALYIALNECLFYTAVLWLSKPKALDLLCGGMWRMLELSCRLCEDPATFISFEPANCWTGNSVLFLGAVILESVIAFRHTWWAELVTICKCESLARILEQFSHCVRYRSYFSVVFSWTPEVHLFSWSIFIRRRVKHLIFLHPAYATYDLHFPFPSWERLIFLICSLCWNRSVLLLLLLLLFLARFYPLPIHTFTGPDTHTVFELRVHRHLEKGWNDHSC